jgi:hypothetical protein
MSVTIEIPVRASQPSETLAELERISIKEAEGILRSKLPPEFRVIGKPEFSYATIRKMKS